MEPPKVPFNINIAINPSAGIVNYIKNKCGLPPDVIEKKLMNGDPFDMIKG